MSALTPVERAEPPWVPLFAAVFDSCDGLLELRALPGRARRFLAPTDNDGITKFLVAHQDEDLYFGVATRRDASSGTLENCRHLGALFVDIDFKATPEADARQRLARLVLPPSIVVQSGGGLHAYWLLREPLDLPDEAEHARQLLRRLAANVGGDLAAAEPARVLRIPGTLNHKKEYGQPRPVQIEGLEAHASAV